MGAQRVSRCAPNILQPCGCICSRVTHSCRYTMLLHARTGTVVWDPHFRLDTHEMQQAFFDLCSSLRTFECKAPGCLRCCDGHPCSRCSNSPTCCCSHVSSHHLQRQHPQHPSAQCQRSIVLPGELSRLVPGTGVAGRCACVCYGNN